MRLLQVELTRLRWRRGILVLILVCLVVPAVIWAGLAWSTRPVSDAEIARAEQTMAEQSRFHERDIRNCIKHPEQYGAGEVDSEASCREMLEPQLEWYLSRAPLQPEEVPGEGGTGVAATLIGLVMIIGATFAGADWASGSMSNQLLFDPRRLRIWLAKAGAVMVAGAATAAVGLALFWFLVVGTAQVRDIEVTAEVWREMRGVGWRATGLAGAAALGGYALTMLLRSTVGTLGLMLVAAVGGSLLISALPIDGNGRWMLGNNVLGVLQSGYEYYDDSVCGGDVFGNCDPYQTLTLGEGLRYLAAVLVPVLALSAWSFRRRDVP